MSHAPKQDSMNAALDAQAAAQEWGDVHESIAITHPLTNIESDVSSMNAVDFRRQTVKDEDEDEEGDVSDARWPSPPRPSVFQREGLVDDDDDNNSEFGEFQSAVPTTKTADPFQQQPVYSSYTYTNDPDPYDEKAPLIRHSSYGPPPPLAAQPPEHDATNESRPEGPGAIFGAADFLTLLTKKPTPSSSTEAHTLKQTKAVCDLAREEANIDARRATTLPPLLHAVGTMSQVPAGSAMSALLAISAQEGAEAMARAKAFAEAKKKAMLNVKDGEQGREQREWRKVVVERRGCGSPPSGDKAGGKIDAGGNVVDVSSSLDLVELESNAWDV
ncbi:hypothetical protein K504DRAFT_523691 [Pleomassaria siparia CBS 279.74]|uniref:Uncharacterized protein n=1 Tax=Pleomassaria siparia CBS 279.74 TaxID=1314801 RepID=A0A6G1KDP0_9PLEO|nr:hypothetical protein K504DRAFT_523691 [Pleomassaria siparia CBS 279.74]